MLTLEKRIQELYIAEMAKKHKPKRCGGRMYSGYTLEFYIAYVGNVEVAKLLVAEDEADAMYAAIYKAAKEFKKIATGKRFVHVTSEPIVMKAALRMDIAKLATSKYQMDNGLYPGAYKFGKPGWKKRIEVNLALAEAELKSLEAMEL